MEEQNKKYKIPAILYESEDQALPYIEVEKDDEMPPSLFIQEYRHTGEVEPDSDGNEQSIIDMYIHMYVDMEFLQKKLSPEVYDDIRVSIGLQPLKKAKEEGQKTLNKVFEKANKEVEEAHKNKDETKNSVLKELNKKLSERFFEKEKEETDEGEEK